MNWTKFSDRLPPEDTQAVFAMAEAGGSIQVWTNRLGWESYKTAAARWHPITYPELPKEETIHDRDDAAFRNWDAAQGILFRYHGPATWHAALAYERAENAKDLANVSDMPAGFHVEPHRESVKRLRKRAGLQ